METNTTLANGTQVFFTVGNSLVSGRVVGQQRDLTMVRCDTGGRIWVATADLQID